MSRAGTYRPPAAPKYTPTAAMRKATAASMRKLAGTLKDDHDGIGAHVHVTDAARALDRGDHEAAMRHLNAAVANMTPQSMYRHGFTNDEDHIRAKASMDAIHRHLLLVKDIHETHQRNQALPRSTPAESVTDPNSPRPSPRPGVTRQEVMNGPRVTDGGGSDPSTAKPVQTTEWKVTKQVAASNGDLTTVLELADGAGTAHATYGGYRMSPAPQDPSARTGKPGPGDAIRCYRCGSGNAPDARHCDQCGFGIEPREAYNHFDSEDVTCPFCGRGDDADAVFCDQCGKRLPESAFAVLSSRYDFPVELSAQTGTLASTPHPFGKPSGPGLWHQKGMQLPPYVQNIAHALLRTGRAKSESEAIAMARAATKRWMSGGGHVHPEVRAAAAASDAQWRAKQAQAHAHSADLTTAIELVGTAAGAAKDPRTPLGTFGSGSGTTPANSSQSGAKTTKSAASSSQAKARLAANAAKKAGLLKAAAGYRAKADALIKQRDALRAQLASASGKTSTGQKGSKTSSGASKTKTSAAKSTAGSTAKSSTTAAKSSTTAKKASTSTKKASSAASKAQILAQVNALNAQIVAYQQQYRQAMAQAAKL